MKKITLLFLICLFALFASKTYALTRFTEAFVRLDRTKASTTTGGTVCAKVSNASAGTEAKVVVSFPTGFTVNSTTSNWTTTTTNLPLGATAWPGISTATNVSGQSVTFPSNDLTSTTTLYCFNFSGTNTLTTSSADNNKTGTIATQSSGGVVIMQQDYAVSTVAADQISLTATVPAQPTDFQATLTQITTGSTFSQNQTIEYRITYGSTLAYATNITVEAEWSLGTITGGSTVDILDYVTSSASNAYNNTTPTVNLTNRKIRWSISSFPANTTGQTVTFKVKTNSNYTGSSTVSFSVSGRVLGPGTQTADSTITKTYQYASTTTPTSTPTPTITPTPKPGPTATPTPGPTATPTLSPTLTPTPAPIGLTFKTISIKTISDSSAQINVGTSKKTTVRLQHGVSETRLVNEVRDTTLQLQKDLQIINLQPETIYYFRIIATDQAGQSITSDTYTFTTAKTSDIPTLDTTSIVVTSSNTIISIPAISSQTVDEKQNEQALVIVIPKNTAYEFKFSLKKQKTIKRLKVVVRKKSKVLGAKNTLGENLIAQADVFAAQEPLSQEPLPDNSSTDASLNTVEVEVTEVSSGIFFGRLKSTAIPGTYELVAIITDDDGNIVEQTLTEMKVIGKFTVISNIDNQPLEAARVYLSRHNEKTKKYEPITPDVLPLENPSFTNRRGELNIVLPQGKYKTLVSLIGYKDTNVFFSIGPQEEDGFPTVLLESTPVTFMRMILYYGRSIKDVFFRYTTLYVDNLRQSLRFFDTVAMASILSLVTISLLAFSVRTHIPLFAVPSHLLYHIESLIWKGKQKYIHGIITNAKDSLPLGKVGIYLINTEKNEIVGHTTTNKRGQFFFRKQQDDNFAITIMKQGFEPTGPLPYPMSVNESIGFSIPLTPTHATKPHILTIPLVLITTAFGLCFEFFLVLSFFFEVLFISEFGLSKTLPYVCLSLINLFLWTMYQRRKK